MGSKKQVKRFSESRPKGPDETDKRIFRTLDPGTEHISRATVGRISSAIVLERIYRKVLEGKTLAEAHGGMLEEATPAVQKAVRDYILLRASKEPSQGVYILNLVEIAHKLGFETDSHHRVQLMLMRRMPPQFQKVLLDVRKLEEIGEALGTGRLPPILAEKEHWNTKHWQMVSALAIATYEGSFKNSETNPLHYLMKRDGRKALVGLISPEHIRTLAYELGIGLRKPITRMTSEQREFIETFAGQESDTEIARALRLPISTVAYFRAKLGIRKKEAVETEQAAAQARELLMREMQRIISDNERISDEDLTSRLHALGFSIARRTINKYRNLLEGAE